MSHNPNIRSEMTKHLLANALRELMEKLPIEKISIEDITSRAGFRRQTFYYHFQDVNSLLVWTFTEDFTRHLSKKKELKDWSDIIPIILEYLEENQDFCLSAYRSNGSNAIKDLIEIEISKVVSNIIEKEMNGISLSEKGIEFIIKFSAGGVANVVEEWLKGTLILSKEDILEHTQKIADIVRVVILMVPEKEEDKKIIPKENK